MKQGIQLFTEVFPLVDTALPRLTAYKVGLEANTVLTVEKARFLAESLCEHFQCGWMWSGSRLLTDSPPNQMKLLMGVDELVRRHAKKLNGIVGLEEDYRWPSRPEWQTAFLLNHRLQPLYQEMHAVLAQSGFRLRHARVEREQRLQAWHVNEQPTLSFSVQSHIYEDPDLQTFVQTLADAEAVYGLLVGDRFSQQRGEVCGVLGTLGEHRARLVELTTRDEMRELLENAPDDEWVVQVQPAMSSTLLDYPASALHVLVGARRDAQGRIVDPEVKPMRPNPALNTQLVKMIADLAKRDGWVQNAYSTQTTPELFETFDTGFEIVFGNGRTRPYDLVRLGQDFSTHGMYWSRERFAEGPMRIGVLNTVDEIVSDFVEMLIRTMKRHFGIELLVVRERKVRVLSAANLESAVRALQKENLDLVLAFVENDVEDEQEALAPSRLIKAHTVARGLAGLLVDVPTMNDPDVLMNIAMGMVARAGNVPYLLDQPLAFADYVVGLDFIHQTKRDGTSTTGLARVYRSDGALLTYLFASVPSDEETGLPVTLLEQLLPASLFAGQRVLLHCYGRLTRADLRALGAWEAEIEAGFYPVQISTQDVPRLYALKNGKIETPPVGTMFRLSPAEAFLCTAVEGGEVYPLPLHVRTEEPLTIEQAVESIMAFTLLHYGALRPPREPVTTLNAQTLRDSITRGVIPETPQGDLPFWL